MSLDWLDFLIRDLCEIPDRNSPEDQPQMLLVTAEEIRAAFDRHIPQRIAALETEVAHWKRLHECAQNANAFRQDAIESLGEVHDIPAFLRK